VNARVKQRNRQRAFLKRKVDANGGAGWRVRKRHRKSALQWLNCLHNQMLPWLMSGLQLFIISAVMLEGMNPLQWPRLGVAPDMGSDGVLKQSYILWMVILNNNNREYFFIVIMTIIIYSICTMARTVVWTSSIHVRTPVIRYGCKASIQYLLL
jgi:hypothetical protein